MALSTHSILPEPPPLPARSPAGTSLTLDSTLKFSDMRLVSSPANDVNSHGLRRIDHEIPKALVNSTHFLSTMPKATRTARRGVHISSAKLNKSPVDPSFDFSKPEIIPSATEGTSGDSEAHESHIVKAQSKKEKQIEKRQLFLQKLGPNPQTLSKSSSRRLKRKTKEQLTGGLVDLQSAIATVEKETANLDEGLTTIGDAKAETTSKPTVKPGTIGKGASSTLSKAQRKRILEIERLRHPLILTNSDFSSNPFQTIRTHAQNTLLKHDSQT